MKILIFLIMKKIKRIIILLVSLIVFSIIYVFQIEPQWIELKSISLPLLNLASEFQGLKIVQFSDLHIHSLTQPQLKKIIQLVNQQNPDFIVFTGDLFTKGDIITDYTVEAIEFFQQLEPQEKTIAVLGNHDYWTDSKEVREIFKKSGVIELSNQVYTFRRNQNKLNFAGLDDVFERKDRLDLVLEQLPAQGTTILLVHEPDFATISAKTRRFELELSGHSHGGQIYLPVLGAIFLPPYGQKYFRGLYQVEEMLHYTNRGLGTSILPIRLNSRPEITVFTLQTF